MTSLPNDLDAARKRLRAQVPAAPYLTVQEAARLARCEHKALRRAVDAGTLRAFSPAGRLLFREDDLRDWIESRPARAPRAQARARRPAPPAPGSVADLREIRRGLTDEAPAV